MLFKSFFSTALLFGAASSFTPTGLIASNKKVTPAYRQPTELNSVAAALTLAAAFGLPTNVRDVVELVKKFDFSKMSVFEESDEDHLNIDLAPSYGTLSADTIEKMDDDVKIMIAGTTNAISKLNNKKWENVISCLQQNPLLEPVDQGVERRDMLVKDFGTAAFKFDGSAETQIMKEVAKWVEDLIEDKEILKSTGIDVDVLGKIVAQTGATVDSFETFVAKKSLQEKTIIEVGVLRYPDTNNRFLQAYRIKFVAWSDCTRILFAQNDKNGITGEFIARRYKPRAGVIANLKDATKEVAVKQALALFTEKDE